MDKEERGFMRWINFMMQHGACAAGGTTPTAVFTTEYGRLQCLGRMEALVAGRANGDVGVTHNALQRVGTAVAAGFIAPRRDRDFQTNVSKPHYRFYQRQSA